MGYTTILRLTETDSVHHPKKTNLDVNIKIRNHKNLTDFEIQLNPLTLIIGENNIGNLHLLNYLGLIFRQNVFLQK